MKILAAIVTHNRCELLERCINHLQKQTRLPDLILVVNNGSTDATVDMLMRRNIRYITQENQVNEFAFADDQCSALATHNDYG